MHYTLKLNDRPFQAIKAGTKKIEGRTPRDTDDSRYKTMKPGDVIIFTNNVTLEAIPCEVLFVRHYVDVRMMLEEESVENVLSSGLDIEGGIRSYNSLDGYEERIRCFGIYAIGVRPITGQSNKSVL